MNVVLTMNWSVLMMVGVILVVAYAVFFGAEDYKSWISRGYSSSFSALEVVPTLETTPRPPAVMQTPTRTMQPGFSPTLAWTWRPGASPTRMLLPMPTATSIKSPLHSPGAPNSLVAIGAGTSIQFGWMDNSFDESGFRIYEQGIAAPVLDNIPPHSGTGGMTFNLTNLPCNKSATYFVKAYNAQGESAASNNANSVTIPCVPTNLGVTAASSTSLNVSFQDNATNENGFRVYVVTSSTPQGTLTAAPSQGIKAGLINDIPCGSTNVYFVRAFNGAGESSNSNTSDGTTQGCTVTVTFTQIHVINGGDISAPDCGTITPRLDCGAKGDVWLDFTVNGQAKRWPADNYTEINNDETKPINGISYTFILPRSQELKIKVSGTNKNSQTPDYPLGMETKPYLGTENWGAGPHMEKPPCANPGGCYEITYNIDVKP